MKESDKPSSSHSVEFLCISLKYPTITAAKVYSYKKEEGEQYALTHHLESLKQAILPLCYLFDCHFIV